MQFHYTEGSKVGDTLYYVPNPKNVGHVPLSPVSRTPAHSISVCNFWTGPDCELKARADTATFIIGLYSTARHNCLVLVPRQRFVKNNYKTSALISSYIEEVVATTSTHCFRVFIGCELLIILHFDWRYSYTAAITFQFSTPEWVPVETTVASLCCWHTSATSLFVFHCSIYFADLSSHHYW